MPAYVNRGLAYMMLGENDKALSDFNAALRLEPAEWTHYFKRGIAYERLGKQQQAADSFVSRRAVLRQVSARLPPRRQPHSRRSATTTWPPSTATRRPNSKPSRRRPSRKRIRSQQGRRSNNPRHAVLTHAQSRSSLTNPPMHCTRYAIPSTRSVGCFTVRLPRRPLSLHAHGPLYWPLSAEQLFG